VTYDTLMVNRDYTPDNDTEEQILAVMKEEGRATPYLIRERTDIRKEYVSRHLDNLRRAGWVTKVTRGLYEFVDDPREDSDD